MSQNLMRQYDDEFVSTSKSFYAQVEDLRVIKAALDRKHDELSMKRSEMLMKQDDLAKITEQMREIQIQRRSVSDRMDELLSEHMSYIKTNQHHRKMA